MKRSDSERYVLTGWNTDGFLVGWDGFAFWTRVAKWVRVFGSEREARDYARQNAAWVKDPYFMPKDQFDYMMISEALELSADMPREERWSVEEM